MDFVYSTYDKNILNDLIKKYQNEDISIIEETEYNGLHRLILSYKINMERKRRRNNKLQNFKKINSHRISRKIEEIYLPNQYAIPYQMLKVYSIPQLGYVTKDDNSIIFNTPSKEYNWYLNIRKKKYSFSPLYSIHDIAFNDFGKQTIPKYKKVSSYPLIIDFFNKYISEIIKHIEYIESETFNKIDKVTGHIDQSSLIPKDVLQNIEKYKKYNLNTAKFMKKHIE